MWRIFAIITFILILLIAELTMGSVHIPLDMVFDSLLGKGPEGAYTIIMVESRIPRAITAMLGGSALALSGLLMQTLFRNPLAGPSVMGISSGASLGVALLVLLSGGIVFGGHAAIAIAAMTGALAVLLTVLAVAKRLADNTSLLIFGIMLSFFTSSVVDALQFKASNESLRSFVNWGMGSFAETNKSEIILMMLLIAAGMLIAFFLKNRLNLLLLGDEYASSMGVNIKSTRLLMILSTGILAGIVTAFCGPVAFIGLAVPHIIRKWLKTSDHRKILLPVILSGAAFALFCDFASRLLQLPLNTIASALGAPVVLWIILLGHKSKSII